MAIHGDMQQQEGAQFAATSTSVKYPIFSYTQEKKSRARPEDLVETENASYAHISNLRGAGQDSGQANDDIARRPRRFSLQDYKSKCFNYSNEFDNMVLPQIKEIVASTFSAVRNGDAVDW